MESRGAEMKQLEIVWKRLLKGGQTCDRCGETEVELGRAVAKLRDCLNPAQFEIALIKQEIDPETFEGTPSESNRIWIAGKSLEDWLGASVGMSKCCSACGDSDCRTVEVAGKVYETIPEDLIFRAGVLAASQQFESITVDTPTASCGCKSNCC